MSSLLWYAVRTAAKVGQGIPIIEIPKYMFCLNFLEQMCSQEDSNGEF